MTNSQKQLSESFTFLQMNFWEGRLYYPIETFLKEVKPDIFSAQEMLTGPVEISPGFHTSEKLIKNGHFKQVIAGPGYHQMIRKGHEFFMNCSTFIADGVTCKSEKRSSINQQTDDLSEVEKTRIAYYGILHTEMQLPHGSIVHILNHHGKLVIHENSRYQNDNADYSFKKIAEYIKGINGPVILSGDFNLCKEATSLQPLKDIGMTNLNDVHNISVARNEFSWKADEAVSHIFINDQVIVEEYRVARDNVSDHCPLVMKCKVVRP